MRHVWKSLLLLAAFILDCTLGAQIEILRISPCFLMVATVAMAMASGEMTEAGIYGAAAGIIADLFWGRTFGFYTLLYLYIALGARAFLELIYKNTPAITAGITFVAVFLCETLLCCFGFAIWGEGHFLYSMFRIIIPTAAYSAFVQIVLFRPITALSKPQTERRTRL